MRGSIRERGATWTVTYDEPSPDGARKQRTKGGFPTKREASAFMTEALQRLGDGSYAVPSKLTVAAYLTDEWLPTATPTLRPLSAAAYEEAIRLRINPYIGATRLQALRGGHLTRCTSSSRAAVSRQPRFGSRMPSSATRAATR
jgi:hypothetical protein